MGIKLDNKIKPLKTSTILKINDLESGTKKTKICVHISSIIKHVMNDIQKLIYQTINKMKLKNSRTEDIEHLRKYIFIIL